MHDSLANSIDKIDGITKPTKTFLKVVINAFTIFRGKANYTNLSRYCHFSERTIRRWFNKGLSYLYLNSTLLNFIPSHHEKIGAIDASFIRKSGNHTDGLAMFWSGCDGKSQKGLEMSLITIVDIDANTAYGLDVKQTIVQEGKTRADLYADHIENSFNELRKHGVTHIAADAYYTKNVFIDRLTNNGFHIVGKLRRDADLKWLYDGIQTGIGRPKKYDGKIVFDDIDKFKHEEIVDEVDIYSAEVYAVKMKKKIKVVLLRNIGEDSYALLFSTDLQLSTQTIIKYYKARFQIEFFIRDSKQHTGLMDCQARKSSAINTHLNMSITALNVLKIEDCLAKESFSKSVISIASWKCIKFNKHYLSGILSMLEISKDDDKYVSVYDAFSNYGVIAA
jgi:hypothetical protein